MADLERGERIRELREARRLTQPAVWERMCAVGGPKPNGKPFISFRMYQRYEEGRGISWEKLRVLAQVLDAGEDYILRGEGERRQPRPARSVDADMAERFAGIEERLDALHDGRVQDQLKDVLRLLREARSEQDRISGLLERQTAVLERIEKATQRADDAAGKLDAAVAQAATALRSSPPAPKRAVSKTAKKRTPRASR